jgi:hypothetical protein
MHFILPILHVGIGHITFVTGLNNVPYKHVSRHVEFFVAFLGYVIKQLNHATVQMASHWLLTGDAWVQFQAQDSLLEGWGAHCCNFVVHP